jgi:hypothetical protein
VSALVMGDAVARFNEGERVHVRLYTFLCLFLWPLSAAASWLAALLMVSVAGFDEQPWLRYPVLLALLAGLVASARSQLRALRSADAALDAFYSGAAAHAATPATPAAPAVQAALLAATAAGAGEASATQRLLAGSGYVLLAAPRCAAKAAYSVRRAISWDAAQLTAAQALFEALGGTGGAWVACSAHPGSGALMAGLERLELVEHRPDQGGEIRLHPDIRRRYFPKDPGQAMFAGPPRRS